METRPKRLDTSSGVEREKGWSYRSGGTLVCVGSSTVSEIEEVL